MLTVLSLPIIGGEDLADNIAKKLKDKNATSKNISIINYKWKQNKSCLN